MPAPGSGRPAAGDKTARLRYAEAAGARLTLDVQSGEAGETALNDLRQADLSSFAWVDGGFGYVVAAPMERERLHGVACAVSQDVDLDAAKQRRAL